MKEWQNLIGMALIAAAILISGILIAQAIGEAGMNLHSGLSYLGELLR